MGHEFKYRNLFHFVQVTLLLQKGVFDDMQTIQKYSSDFWDVPVNSSFYGTQVLMQNLVN